MPPPTMGLNINGRFRLTSGLECQVFGAEAVAPHRGVEVWTEDALVRWDRHGEPLTQIFQGFDAKGARKEVDHAYRPWSWDSVSKELGPLLDRIGHRGSERHYVLAPITSLIDAVAKGIPPRITGETQRHALEVAIASKMSAQRGSVPIKLPLEDRSLALYPRPYRWLGGDVSGRPPVGHRGRRQEVITSRPGRFQAQWLFENVFASSGGGLSAGQ